MQMQLNEEGQCEQNYIKCWGGCATFETQVEKMPSKVKRILTLLIEQSNPKA